MHKWILPTLSEVLALSESTSANCPSEKAEWIAVTQNCESNITAPVDSKNQNGVERLRAEAEWCGAIAATEQLLLQSINSEVLAVDGHLTPIPGLVFAGPVPVLSHETLVASLPTWIFTAESSHKQEMLFQLPPATAMLPKSHLIPAAQIAPNAESLLPLLPGDPLSNEQFCLVLTTGFSLVMVLGEDINGVPAFLFSFEPEVIEQAWRSLRARIVLSSPHFPLSQMDALIEQHYLVVPDYRTVTQFSRLLIKHLPKVGADVSESVAVANLPTLRREVSEVHQQKEDSSLFGASKLSYSDVIAAPALKRQENDDSSPRPDVELLKAFAHEVRTPLTTIRTLTRLLLKRCDLATDVIKRLKIIDHECTEQIDRMELLFRAAELESTDKHPSAHLTAMSLAQVLQQSIPRWQKSASRRNLTLDVVLPQQLPTVVSDPIMLDQVLTGLIENFTRSLSAGSHIQVQVILAGDQLKLQLLTQSQPGKSDTVEQSSVPPTRQSLGQLLIFHPETGNISLNFAATKHLFQAIGGKLIVRQRPHQGEVLTIFLPMEVSPADFSHRGKGAVHQSAN